METTNKLLTIKYSVENDNEISDKDYLLKNKAYIVDLTSVNGFKYLVEVNKNELVLIPINLTYRWKFYIFWFAFVCFLAFPTIPAAFEDNNPVFGFSVIFMIIFSLIIFYFSYRIEKNKALKFLKTKSKFLQKD